MAVTSRPGEFLEGFWFHNLLSPSSNLFCCGAEAVECVVGIRVVSRPGEFLRGFGFKKHY